MGNATTALICVIIFVLLFIGYLAIAFIGLVTVHVRCANSFADEFSPRLQLIIAELVYCFHAPDGGDSQSGLLIVSANSLNMKLKLILIRGSLLSLASTECIK